MKILGIVRRTDHQIWGRRAFPRNPMAADARRMLEQSGLRHPERTARSPVACRLDGYQTAVVQVLRNYDKNRKNDATESSKPFIFLQEVLVAGKMNHDCEDHGPRRERPEEGENSMVQMKRVGKPYVPPDPTDDEVLIFGAGISSGKNFNKLDNIRINVSGKNAPRPINSFERCGLLEFVVENVMKSNYIRPTPIQKYAIPIVVAGRDLMGCAQTGSGKTAAFLLPIINMLLSDKRDLVLATEPCEPQVVILSPTRELTLQIFSEARKFAFGSIIKVAVVYGGTAMYHQAQQVKRGCHILVATPGRLLDFVNRQLITFSSIRFMVLDEADKMLDMGFFPDVEKLLNHPTMVPKGEYQTLMFSATFREDIQFLAGKFLNNYLFVAVGVVGGACTDVEQNFFKVTRFEKREKLLELLSNTDTEKTLVFVDKKRHADFIASYLCEANIPTTSIHGDRLQQEREQALDDFKCGRMKILVATAVAGRGLDIKNVAHVVNYDLPKSIDEYVHRIGRTGRVGNRGRATSFYDAEVDLPIARGLVTILTQAEQPVPDFFESDAQGGGGSGSYRGGGGGESCRGGRAESCRGGHAGSCRGGRAGSCRGGRGGSGRGGGARPRGASFGGRDVRCFQDRSEVKVSRSTPEIEESW